MTDSVSKLSDDVKSQIAGIVLFGDTRNKQTDGSIPNLSKDKTKIYCAAGDRVCDGTLIVTAAHLTYGDDVSAAAEWLESAVSAAGSSSGSS